MGIYTAGSGDTWVGDQFVGFDGFPPDELGQLAIAAPANGPALMNSNPAAAITSVFGANMLGGGTDSMQDAASAAALSVNGNAGTGNQGGMIGPAVLPSLQPMPSMTTASMPTMTGTANAGGTNGSVGTTPPVITPEYLTQRLPSIVNPAPAVIAPDCGGGFAGWVADNPGIAVLGLAALAFMVWGKK